MITDLTVFVRTELRSIAFANSLRRPVVVRIISRMIRGSFTTGFSRKWQEIRRY